MHVQNMYNGLEIKYLQFNMYKNLYKSRTL